MAGCRLIRLMACSEVDKSDAYFCVLFSASWEDHCLYRNISSVLLKYYVNCLSVAVSDIQLFISYEKLDLSFSELHKTCKYPGIMCM